MAVSEAKNLGHYDSIVLGAGMAGLACASQLLQENHTTSGANRLRVLEARDRVGGRAASVQIQGCRSGTGANWIHGTGTAEGPNPPMDILLRKRHRSMEGPVLFQTPANGVDDPVTENSEITAECVTDVSARPVVHPTCSATAATSTHGLTLPAQVTGLILSCAQKVAEEAADLAAALPEEEAKHMSVLQVLVSTQAFHEAYELVPREYHDTLSLLFQSMENMEAAPLLELSSEPGSPESQLGTGLPEYAVDCFDGEHVFLQDNCTAAMDEITRLLVDAGAIALETVVTRVDWNRSPIVIETSRGNFTAREVVCTLPLDVLKDSVKDSLFVPSLPTDTQEAIDCLGSGTVDKIFAVYSQPWWYGAAYCSVIKDGFIKTESQCDSHAPGWFLDFTPESSGISVKPDRPVSPDMYRLPIMNLHAMTDHPVLCALVSCNTATTVEGMKDEDISELFHRTLTQWLGIEPPKPDAVYVTRWAQDPYSRSSYSHNIAGLSEAGHREALQQPIHIEGGSVLRFAGEHCSRDSFATVHGALMDGLRAADASLQQSQ